MALLNLLLFLLPFHLLPPGAKPNPECSHQCGNISLDFPFTTTNTSNTDCKSIFVNGCDSQHPKIIISPAHHEYTILGKMTSGNQFYVLDSQLEGFLNKKSCHSFRNLTQPEYPYSFTFYPNITLFTCGDTAHLNQTQQFFKRYPKFDDYDTRDCPPDLKTVYIGNHEDPSPDMGGSEIPKGCRMIQLPIKEPTTLKEEPTTLKEPYQLSWISPRFTLEWRESSVPQACEFDCNKGSNRTRVKVLAICIPGSVILLLLAGYIIWQRKKKFGGVYLLPRNISFDPSSRSFVEDGSFNFSIPIFSYTELVEATSNFDSSQELGDGGFGTVYYGKLQDGREVAIKRLYEHNYRRVEQFLNEIKILSSLRHPNLVFLYGCTSRRSHELLLVHEYIPNGTVADHLHGYRAKEALLTWTIRMSIARETATALAYLHNSGFIHRDVKTTNILLDNNFSVKVADFGLSRLFPMNVTHISTAPRGTPGYVDPEYHQCYQLTDKSDVYSFGVVLIELISSMPAVDISRHRHEINLANLAVNRIQRCAFGELIDPSTGYNSDPQVTMMTTSVAELAFRCLQLEKDLRPSMEEVRLFLQDIQSGQGCNFEQIKKEANGKHSSPETDAALLKSKNY